jgi:glyoxylase-like metal-dependent hydrolase (beta-lactamase superfamily II)
MVLASIGSSGIFDRHAAGLDGLCRRDLDPAVAHVLAAEDRDLLAAQAGEHGDILDQPRCCADRVFFVEGIDLVQRPGVKPLARRYILYAQSRIGFHNAALAKGRIETIAGDHDLFGDSSVVMKSLPGHTPGHQGLLVNLPQTGPIVLGTDIAYSTQDYMDCVLRKSNFDLEQTLQSISTVKRMEREIGAQVWLHHDIESQRGIRCAPHYYE